MSMERDLDFLADLVDNRPEKVDKPFYYACDFDCETCEFESYEYFE